MTPKLKITKTKEFLLQKSSKSDSMLEELFGYYKKYDEIEVIGKGF